MLLGVKLCGMLEEGSVDPDVLRKSTLVAMATADGYETAEFYQTNLETNSEQMSYL